MDILKSQHRAMLNLPDLAILEGDCRDMAELPSESIDLAIAEPPFLEGIAYGDDTDDHQLKMEYLEFTDDWLREALRVLKPGGQVYAFMRLKWMDAWLPLIAHLNWHIIPWCQTLANRPWTPILWITKGDRPTVFRRTYRFEHDRDWLLGSSPIEESAGIHQQKRHRTLLPEWLYSYFIIRSSEPGMTVLDPMMGSAAAAHAATAMGRRFVGYSVNRDYGDLAYPALSPTPVVSELDRLEEIMDGFHQMEMARKWDTARRISWLRPA